MNKLTAGIVTFLSAWLVIPIITGLFFVLSRLIEMLFQASFNWSMVFVISVGVGILGGIFVGAKIWSRFTGGVSESSNKFITPNTSSTQHWGAPFWWIFGLLFGVAFLWLLF